MIDFSHFFNNNRSESAFIPKVTCSSSKILDSIMQGIPVSFHVLSWCTGRAGRASLHQWRFFLMLVVTASVNTQPRKQKWSNCWPPSVLQVEQPEKLSLYRASSSSDSECVAGPLKKIRALRRTLLLSFSRDTFLYLR